MITDVACVTLISHEAGLHRANFCIELQCQLSTDRVDALSTMLSNCMLERELKSMRFSTLYLLGMG
jgi:hypothetical protein